MFYCSKLPNFAELNIKDLNMLHCVIAIARVVDDNQFRRFIKRSSIACDVVRVYRPHNSDLCIKVPFAAVPRVLDFLKKNVICYCVLYYV